MSRSLLLPLFGAALCLCAPLCHGTTGNGQTPGRNTTTPAPGRSSVRVVEREMLTYPYSAPKEVPDFGRIYPYHRYDGYTAEGRMQKWEMVEMENDYIKLWIMPGVGGKIWGAVDKRTGREFIYFNHVVKFRDVAMRGPWTSGGIEMNFGIIGHSPWCSDRVDYAIAENADGSVSCTVGGTDLALGTDWRVRITLPPDKALFETDVLWFNGSGWDRPAYQWMNAGIKTAGNLEYSFPGVRYLEHDGTSRHWPTGYPDYRLNRYEENNHGHYKSYHVTGEYTDFWGGYWHDDGFGFGHTAEYADKPGKKIWIWGLSPYGMIWEKLLTDSDGQYSEVQSGRLLNQSIGTSYRTPFKHGALSPYVTNAWSERWFPVRGTDGILYATDELAFNIVPGNGQQTLKIYAIAPVSGELLLTSDGNKEILRSQLELNPTDTLSLPLGVQEVPDFLDLYLDGRNLYCFELHDTPLMRPQRLPENFDHGSVYGLYLQGREFERQFFLSAAADRYREALAKDPNYQPALVRLAGICFQRHESGEALELCARALAIDTYDGAANYLWGLRAAEEFDTANAMEGFALASQSTEYREAACTEMARLWISEQQVYPKARHYARRALEYNPRNLTALQLEVLLDRIERERSAANASTTDTTSISRTSAPSGTAPQTSLDRLQQIDPLNHFAAWERYLLSGREADKKAFTDGIRNSFAAESYLHIADFYYRAGRWRDALTLLAAAPEHPKILCWQAWLWMCLQNFNGHNDEVERLLTKIAATRPSLVFPFRRSEYDLFSWLAGTLPSWQGNYYLALCKMQDGHRDEALELLNHPKGDSAKIDFYPYFALRASLQSDSSRAESDLLEAFRIAPDDPHTTWLLADHYTGRNQWAEAQKYLTRRLSVDKSDYTAGMKLAKVLAAQGAFQQSIALMRSLDVLPNEGAQEGRNLWRETNLDYACALIGAKQFRKALDAIAQARLWPENMGVGKPYDDLVDERVEDFLERYCLLQMHRNGEAAASRIAARIETPGYKPYRAADLLSALMLREAGQVEKGDRLMAEWLHSAPDKKSARWCDAVYRGDWNAAERIEQEPNEVLNPLPYEILFDDRDFLLLMRHQNLLKPETKP